MGSMQISNHWRPLFATWAAVFAAMLAAAAMAGCASYNPGALAVGSSAAAAQQALGTPVARYALPAHGERLEYARGPSAQETYMLDFDAAGALVASTQVRTEANLMTIAPGLSREALLLNIGHPTSTFSVPRQKLQVWNYRYVGGDCRWFQVSVSNDGAVTEASFGTDPACDGPNNNS